MGRPFRASDGGYVYHALNRANGRMPLFEKDADYEAFERVLHEALDRVPVRLLACCVMPNLWHLVLWPRNDGDLSRFVGWLSLTHTQRWHAHRHSAGTGHLYQGGFKSFPVQEDDHLLTLCRYTERNALRAGLVRKAELWRWGSLWRRESGNEAERAILSPWPIGPPRRWVEIVNAAQTQPEVEAIRAAVQRGRPFGSDRWVKSAASRLNLEGTLRPRGRPAKSPEDGGKGSWHLFFSRLMLRALPSKKLVAPPEVVLLNTMMSLPEVALFMQKRRSPLVPLPVPESPVPVTVNVVGTVRSSRLLTSRRTERLTARERLGASHLGHQDRREFNMMHLRGRGHGRRERRRRESGVTRERTRFEV